MLLNGHVMTKERMKFCFFLSEGGESVYKDLSVEEASKATKNK